MKLIARVKKNLDLFPYTFEDIDGTFYDYTDLIIQLGYIIMFSTCFEIAPLISFASNFYKLKLDRRNHLELI